MSCRETGHHVFAAALATVLRGSSEVCLIEGTVIADEGVFDADHSAGDGDKADLCGFSCGAPVEMQFLHTLASGNDKKRRPGSHLTAR
jgi:hypothetical protein